MKDAVFKRNTISKIQFPAWSYWNGSSCGNCCFVFYEDHCIAKRNPYNEVEYGNHYTRAMSSYGAFIAANGFKYHGPKGEISFAPKINPENFTSAFIAAVGWGSFSQNKSGNSQINSLELVYGELKLNSSSNLSPLTCLQVLTSHTLFQLPFLVVTLN